MSPLRAPFGFSADASLRFTIDGRSYHLNSNGVRTLQLLAKMYHATGPDDDTTSVFSLRHQIRQIESIKTRAVLNLVIISTHSRRLRVLAIWMRGRYGGSLGTPLVAQYCFDPDVQTRKAVVRALKRMGAWSELRAMADHDPNPRIRHMATPPPPRSFVSRVSEFTSHAERREVTPVKRDLFVSPKVDYGQGRPAKSPTFIRMILERIHRILIGQYD